HCFCSCSLGSSSSSQSGPCRVSTSAHLRLRPATSPVRAASRTLSSSPAMVLGVSHRRLRHQAQSPAVSCITSLTSPSFGATLFKPASLTVTVFLLRSVHLFFPCALLFPSALRPCSIAATSIL